MTATYTNFPFQAYPAYHSRIYLRPADCYASISLIAIRSPYPYLQTSRPLIPHTHLLLPVACHPPPWLLVSFPSWFYQCLAVGPQALTMTLNNATVYSSAAETSRCRLPCFSLRPLRNVAGMTTTVVLRDAEMMGRQLARHCGPKIRPHLLSRPKARAQSVELILGLLMHKLGLSQPFTLPDKGHFACRTCSRAYAVFGAHVPHFNRGTVLAAVTIFAPA